jgi:energy-coupling factor transporter transmembrane protein EcfT
LFIGASVLLTLGYIALPFLPQLSNMEGIIWKSGFLFLLSAIIVFLLWKIPGQRLLTFALVLIVARMAFGWFVWPQRAPHFEQFEQDAIQVAQITNDEPVYYYQAEMLQYGASYIMTREKQTIIQQEKGEPRVGVFYITDDAGLNSINENADSLQLFFTYPNAEDGRNLNLIKIIE